MTHSHWLGIIFLTLAVGVLSFARLGDRAAPQTSWVPQQGEHAFFDFGEAIQLSAIQFRMGARHDQGFTLWYANVGGDWQLFERVTRANVFYWEKIPVDITARFVALTATGWDLRLQEIAFRGGDGALLTGFATSPNAAALTDEQSLVPLRRSFMNSTYFDEIYHPRTGYEYLHRLRVFETTHPPMGKNFIAASVHFLGMTPFAWRLPGTLFGVLMVPLLYAFARLLFKSNNWALFAAFIFSFDFMRFTQTRLATIDTYVAFFVLAMYFCMYGYVREVKHYGDDPSYEKSGFARRSLVWLALCGTMTGLAIASKWQGVYGALGLPILFFPALYNLYKHNPRLAKITFFACFGFFIALPVGIYTLSYIPFILAQGGGLRAAWDNQYHMFSYHAHLVAEHGFASRWWSWPLMLWPIWIYVDRISPYVNAGMTSFGNPAVWWFGIVAAWVAVVTVVWELSIKKNAAKTAVPLFLLVGYAAQFLPWALVGRLTFIYHYFPSVPFVVLLITWFFMRYVKKNAITYAYAGVVFALFALFYPVLSGWPINPDFARTWLAWLPGWVFM